MFKIYLIPNFLAPSAIEHTFPFYNLEVIKSISSFFVEEERNARRFLKKIFPLIDLSTIVLIPMGKHSDITQAKEYLLKCQRDGKSVGMLSESGYPCVADPGSDLLAFAHQKDMYIEPLVGPSSIIMALAASGLNGQHFTFHGYLPIDLPDKVAFLNRIQSLIQKEKSTHIFIETPFRNEALVQLIVKQMNGAIRLCIAKEIMSEEASIQTYPLSIWKQKDVSIFHKKNTIFLLGS